MSVLTTIQAPTPSVIELARAGHRFGVRTLAIGDAKSPDVAWPTSFTRSSAWAAVSVAVWMACSGVAP